MREIYDEDDHYLPPRSSCKQNILLQKSYIGIAKSATFELPPKEFCYGRKNIPNKESAGDVVLNWVGSVPNPQSKPKRDFLAMNRKALSSGCLTATEVRDFQKNNRILQRCKRKKKITTTNRIDKNVTYGVKSENSEPFKRLINNDYQKKFVESQREKLLGYEDAHKQSHIVIKPTKASRGHAAWKNATETKTKEELINNFTLKQFQNIPQKIHTKN